ncbi:hypothetical protein TWF694_000004 [Orbilia ellipsospora]|uniref:Mitochondrial cardiolipin hydrolase n=1 Tax=Orbilia ellipsospora TaxID=2528407 RepID=A0AAV9XNQ2_9PEZI
MPRGKRIGDEDGTWRPSHEDMVGEEEDRMLEEELEMISIDRKPKAQKNNPKKLPTGFRQKKGVRGIDHKDPQDSEDAEFEDEEFESEFDDDLSPSKQSHLTPRHNNLSVHHRKPSHKYKRREDGHSWEATGKDIGDEELEVEEIVNYQLLGDELLERKPRRPSLRRKKNHDDELWKPEGEGLDEEGPEDEELSSRCHRRAKPKETPSTTPKKSKKQPADSSSPGQPKPAAPGPRLAWRITPAGNKKPPNFLEKGQNARAPFTFIAYRGEGMCMLAMNWKNGPPPNEFVGFSIEYQEPQSSVWRTIPNYLTFPNQAVQEGSDAFSSHLSPHQRFRWVHFPYSVNTPGQFYYRVIPVFMKGNGNDYTLIYGEMQEVALELMAETYPREMNIAFTRGFISSKAFLGKFGADGVGNILPANAKDGLTFKPKLDSQNEEKALSWMGMEAREVILGALDAAIKDTTAEVRVLAYDFNEPEIISRLQKLGKRLRVIIDDSNSHSAKEDAESKAAEMLRKTAGKNNVQRQHMGALQHNKVIIVDGTETAIAIGGSTNFSWRGLYVQNNNIVALQGAQPVKIFKEAFDNYWSHPNDTDGFYKTTSAQWMDLGLGIDAQVTFSPHSSSQGTLDGVAADIKACKSSLFYSLAFLYETPGTIRETIEMKMGQKGVMVYGISDKSVGGLDVRKNGNPPVAYPEDFEAESSGGSGARMHHKFVVIDFNTPDARVYTGSHNLSVAADTKNAENLFLIRDQRIATSYMIEAVAMFDHYEVRDHVAKKKGAEKKGEKHAIHLRLPPTKRGEKPWWDQYWSVQQMINDREMFGV